MGKNPYIEIHMKLTDAAPFIKMFPDRIKRDEPLSRYTTFKIGGPADLFYEARTTEELVAVIKEARKCAIPIFVLGGGTNILIGDKGIRGLVIRNNTSRIIMRGVKGERRGSAAKSVAYVEADSGVIFNKFVRYTIEEGFAGIEMHLGLPGTVGGAVYMNSKWTHPEGFVGDVIHQAEILTPKDTLELVPKSYFKFGYDTSSIQRSGDIVIKVIFALIIDEKKRLWDVANQSIAYRRETQPQGIMSAGCTFQNISKAEAISRSLPNQTTSAGFLVDHAGLKGFAIGGAQISPVHANFIINNGKATASDVIQLIDRARDQVKKQFGVVLKEEIVRVGEF
jgi:UDP-N-acetylenolpyruvoylglucosamine reductase